MNSRPCFLCFVLMSTMALGPLAHAQWSSDPATNLAVADRPGEQTQPKIRVVSGGGCYISWYDNASGGYDMYLQRLDAGGAEQWPHNGVLVADTSFSSTQDYGLEVDTLGNALLTFRDDRFGGVQITAAKIDPGGALLWGANGIQVTSTADFVAAPKIAGTSDGQIVVGWTQDTDVHLQKLDAGGSAQWGAGVTLTDAASLSLSDLHASDAGGVIASWVRSVSFPSPKHLYTRKFDSAGAALWPGPVIVFDGGSLQFGNFPPFVPDGNGGAVFAWYGVSPLQCYVQHVLAAGSEKFAHNGVSAATLAGRDRVEPGMSYNPASDEIFLFWREQIALPFQVGVYGQRFAPDGSRQWGSSGLQVVPLSAANDYTQVRSLALEDGAAVFFVETLSFGNDRVHGSRLDGGGGAVWSPSIIDISTPVSGKSRLAAAQAPGEVSLLAWVDARADAGDAYAQNINPDGTLGAAERPVPAASLLGLAVMIMLVFVVAARVMGAEPAVEHDE